MPIIPLFFDVTAVGALAAHVTDMTVDAFGRVDTAFAALARAEFPLADGGPHLDRGGGRCRVREGVPGPGTATRSRTRPPEDGGRGRGAPRRKRG